MNILQTTTFSKQVKKLHQNQREDLDEAVQMIVSNPSIGEMKQGDLLGVRVYKFKMVKQLTLLAYTFHADVVQLVLLAVGSHENFYRDLKH